MTAPVVGRNALTLTFDDPSVERAYWRDFAVSHRRQFQYGLLGLIGLLLLFAPVDLAVYPQNVTKVWISRYGIAFPILLAAVPVLFSPRLRGLWERRPQEILFAVGIGTVAPVVLAGWFASAGAGTRQIYVGALGMFIVAEFLFGFSRMRFVYALALGVGAITLANLMMGWRMESDPMLTSSTLVVSVVMLFIGGLVSYSLEYYARRDYLQRLILEQEQRRADELLHNILPEEIAGRLRSGEAVIADRHTEVAVLFADLTGFTTMSESIAPDAMVALLDALTLRFDDKIDSMGLEKIKTIGDAWMVAGGVPRPTDGHVAATAKLGLHMIEVVHQLAALTGLPLDLRVGIHVGPAVAGVIGTEKFAYDLWGDTVNTASRMESSGEAGRVQVSEAVYHRLEGLYAMTARGEIEVKGKGPMKTWWVDRALARTQELRAVVAE